MNKTILITGAAGNLGQACTRYFLEAGATVIALVSKRNADSLQSAEKLQVYTADLTKESEVINVINAVSASQKIDAGLFLAGGFSGGSLEKTNSEMIQRMFSINFETAFFISKALFLKMQDQQKGGSLVFVSSQTGIEPSQGKSAVAYTLSKSLLVPFADILNEEGKSTGITSTVIAPKTIDTPQNREAMPGADFSTWTTPESIALQIGKIIMGEMKEPVIKI